MKTPAGMKRKWSWTHRRWLYVCDFCGGNCGQCGDTGKYNRLNDDIVVPASMDTMWKNLGSKMWRRFRRADGKAKKLPPEGSAARLS